MPWSRSSTSWSDSRCSSSASRRYPWSLDRAPAGPALARAIREPLPPGEHASQSLRCAARRRLAGFRDHPRPQRVDDHRDGGPIRVGLHLPSARAAGGGRPQHRRYRHDRAAARGGGLAGAAGAGRATATGLVRQALGLRSGVPRGAGRAPPLYRRRHQAPARAARAVGRCAARGGCRSADRRPATALRHVLGASGDAADLAAARAAVPSGPGEPRQPRARRHRQRPVHPGAARELRSGRDP